MELSPDHFHPLPVADRWCVHSYYTLCPYAPDGSGRILVAGADLATGEGEVLILNGDGAVADRFPAGRVTPSFWHTGFWQSWFHDAKSVCFQSGTMIEPHIIKRDLANGNQTTVEGDLEGLPLAGEPYLSASHGLLYAAGYGDGQYKPDQAPMPFQARDRHGLSTITFTPPASTLTLSTQAILDLHPDRDRLMAADREIKVRLGSDDGLTLMTYCVRWNPAGDRCLFYFGNHCVDRKRNEPRLAYIFTADRNLKDIRLALDISYERRGVHWGWQADNRRLIGYGPRPDAPARICVAEVNADGSDYRKLSDHASGGHPSTSPTDKDLIVTDEGGPGGCGRVVFISRKTGGERAFIRLPKYTGEKEAPGRNRHRICHHPVFNPLGTRVLVNTLGGEHAALAEINLDGV